MSGPPLCLSIVAVNICPCNCVCTRVRVCVCVCLKSPFSGAVPLCYYISTDFSSLPASALHRQDKLNVSASINNRMCQQTHCWQICSKRLVVQRVWMTDLTNVLSHQTFPPLELIKRRCLCSHVTPQLIPVHPPWISLIKMWPWRSIKRIHKGKVILVRKGGGVRSFYFVFTISENLELIKNWN